MWMKTSHGASVRPASRTRTRFAGSAERRFASAQPAEPPPTMTKSYWEVATTCDISQRVTAANSPLGAPEPAGIVIVGGGVAGASEAYHLAKLGRTDVVLVDQGPLWETGGSTSHAPGLVFQHNPSRTMTRFAQETVALFGELGCFHSVGGIEVAATLARWEELHRRLGRAMSFGLPAALLEPAQVRALVPLVDPERILGGLHTPTDGIAKALRAAAAMAEAAGVTALGGCTVTGFQIDRGAVRAVETTLGTIRTDT